MTSAAPTILIPLACTTILSIAVTTDLIRRIIPNTLTAIALTGGMGYHWLSSGSVDGIWFSLAGLLVGGLLLLAPYCLDFTGAGDVKLLAALGAWVGPVAIAHVFICSTLAGGIMATGSMLRHARRTVSRPGPAVEDANSSQETSPRRGLPYALAIGIGYFFWMAWEAPP